MANSPFNDNGLSEMRRARLPVNSLDYRRGMITVVAYMNDKGILFLVIAVCSLGGVTASDLPKRQADMTKLLKASSRMEEVKRLSGMKKYHKDVRKMELSEWQDKMADVRVVKCPQRSGDSLYLVMPKRGENFYSGSGTSSLLDRDEYQIDQADEIFQPDQAKVNLTLRDLDLTDSERIGGYELSVFDSIGKELHPFGGSNYLSSGYCFDMNGDGLLEVLDSSNWGVVDNFSVKSITLQTLERHPKQLLSVVYEWHPDDSSDCNEWGYAVKDVNGDGFYDVVLGPKGDDPKVPCEVAVIYLWDDKKKEYTGPEGGKGDHFVRLHGKKTWKALKKMKGLGYPLLKDESDAEEETKIGAVTRAEVLARPLHPLPDFSTMDIDQIVTFFGPGKTQKDKDEKGFPTLFPKGMKKWSPKQAAFAYVQANRNEHHRRNFQLAIDDRNGVKPPKTGWLVYNQHSSGCYTYVESLWAISLDQHCLIYCTNSSNGVVGSNPFLDDVGYDIRVIQMEPSEVTYVCEVLWWLDRIRSKKKMGDDDSGGSHMSSSADGGCSMYFFHKGKTKVKFSGVTRWFGWTSSRWDSGYSKEVCGNLSGSFYQEYLPELLGERWSQYAKLEHRNLMTSPEEKKRDRHSYDQKAALQRSFQKVFRLHDDLQAPAEVLAWIARVVGDLGMQEFVEPLKMIQSELAPMSAEEKEYLSLKPELQGKSRPSRFSEKLTPSDKGLLLKFDRLDELNLALMSDYNKILREQLTRSLAKVELINNPAELTQVSLSGQHNAYWAQQELRKRYPDEYADVLMEMLRRAQANRHKEQALELLINFSPEKALEFIDEMNDADRSYFCLSLVDLYKKHAPEKMDQLFIWVAAKARNPKTSWEHRHKAVRYLTPQWFPSQEDVAYLLLIDILREKEIKSEDYNPHPQAACISSLVEWPRARKEWDRIKKLSEQRTGESSWGDNEVKSALVGLSAHCGPQVRTKVQVMLEDRLLNSMGLMDGQLDFIFSHGYQECLPLIERMATADVSEYQNRWAVMGQEAGNFPTGRQSYHAARHIRALWLECNPDVRAHIWASKALVDPSLFLERESSGDSIKLNRVGHILAALLEKYPEVKKKYLDRVDLQKVYSMQWHHALRDELLDAE